MQKILATILFLAAASAQAQSYSKIKQHVREYDRLAGQMEDIIGTAVSVESPATGAGIKYDGTNWISSVIPIDMLYASEAVVLQASTNLGTVFPGQLVYLDTATDGNRHEYICTNEFNSQSYVSGDTTWLPGGANDDYWRIFVRQGRIGLTGAHGADGDDGLDGVGNITYGIWDKTKEYLYDTNSPIVASYAGRWYDCIASSTGMYPTAASGTNYWAVSIDKGSDGDLIGWTNLVFRGNWNSGDTYTTNDAVWYSGNLFAVGETNIAPVTGDAPTLDVDYVGSDDGNWSILVKRGLRGVQGKDGNQIDSYTVYTFLPGTNTFFDNEPSSANRHPVWVSTAGENMTVKWTGESYLGTNVLSSTGGVLILNGHLAEQDPVYLAWLASDFTNTVQSIASTATGVISVAESSSMRVSPMPTVTLSVADNWQMFYVPTGATEIALSDKTTATNVASIRLDLDLLTGWATDISLCITNMNHDISAFSSGAVYTLLFDYPANGTNWVGRLLE